MPQIPQAPPTENNRWQVRLTLAVLVACAVYVCALAFVPGFTTSSPLVCPTSRCLGLQCPSCGMTRAMACLVRCDVVSALRYNPLIVFAAPFTLGFVVDTLLRFAGREGIGDRLPRLQRWGWRCLLVAFMVVGMVRAATWLAPACNPEGWLMPPAQFPPSGRRERDDRGELTDGLVAARIAGPERARSMIASDVAARWRCGVAT